MVGVKPAVLAAGDEVGAAAHAAADPVGVGERGQTAPAGPAPARGDDEVHRLVQQPLPHEGAETHRRAVVPEDEGEVGVTGGDGRQRLGRLGLLETDLDVGVVGRERADRVGHQGRGGRREGDQADPAGPQLGERGELLLGGVQLGGDDVGAAQQDGPGLGGGDAGRAAQQQRARRRRAPGGRGAG